MAPTVAFDGVDPFRRTPYRHDSKSGYYDWYERAPSKRHVANALLLDQIKAAQAMSDETYGMPRIREELADAGTVASRKRIAALMRASGIAGVSRRLSYCVTTKRNPQGSARA
jgi:putative transposase